MISGGRAGVCLRDRMINRHNYADESWCGEAVFVGRASSRTELTA
jgi:hypothetical protein